MVWRHFEQSIGILKKEANLVTKSVNKVWEDGVISAQSFVHNRKNYLVLDIGQLYNELGV